MKRRDFLKVRQAVRRGRRLAAIAHRAEIKWRMTVQFSGNR